LIELDVPELRDEVAQKEAAVELEAANVKRHEAAIRVAQAARETAAAREAEARAAQSRASAEQERWRAEYDRISMLAARMAISDKVLDETRSKLAAAQAAWEESDARIRSMEAAAAEAVALVAQAEADRDAAAARAKAAGAERDRARTMAGYAELRAPFDGVVAARHVDVGHLVGTGAGPGNSSSNLGGGGAGNSQAKAPLLEIVTVDPVRIVVDVPESDAVMVEAGAAASVRVASLGSVPFDGQVARTTWSLHQATRTMRVEIDVPNPKRQLRPGMFAHAKIKVAERSETLVLPKTAILPGPGKPACWVIGPSGTLARRELQLGLEASGEVEVIGGLNPDEDVIGQNVAAFREGQAVDRATPKL
jgi:multidrug efflux pump subunit AcrA (membrane-fusion protein)